MAANCFKGKSRLQVINRINMSGSLEDVNWNNVSLFFPINFYSDDFKY